MAKVITIANSKGGVGKSTLVLHIFNYLVQHGARVAIADLDYQQSLSSLGKDIPFVDASAVGSSSDWQFILVDSPAYRSPDVVKIIADSDFVLIPVKPSVLDVRAAVTTIEDCREQGTKYGLVLNMVQPGTSFPGQIRSQLEGDGLPVLKTEIGQRISYARSLLFDSLEDEDNKKASDEIADLTNEILIQIS